MKKQLNEETIENELKEGSAFFRKRDEEGVEAKPPIEDADTVVLSDQPSPKVQGPTGAYEELPEEVRKAVKEFGKEAATHRFTKEEKQEISRLIFSYSTKGVRTSENEISRIAVNFLIRDYKQNLSDSILDTVLRNLNS